MSYIYKYGTFADYQLEYNIKFFRKKIFYLLLYVDPKTKEQYKDTVVRDAFNGLLYELGGLNSILNEPHSLVRVISMLEAALLEYSKYEINPTDFNFNKYRKLILDSGNEILKIEKIKVPDKVEDGE